MAGRSAPPARAGEPQRAAATAPPFSCAAYPGPAPPHSPARRSAAASSRLWVRGQQPRPPRLSSCDAPILPLSVSSRLSHAALHQPATHSPGPLLRHRTDPRSTRAPPPWPRPRIRARAPPRPASQQPSLRPALRRSQSPTPQRPPQPYGTGRDGTGRNEIGGAGREAALLPRRLCCLVVSGYPPGTK